MEPERPPSSPSVSVVLPTANRPHLLLRAIQSVLDQTFPDLEVIVVDDGMRESAEQEVRTLSDPRVRYFRNEMNIGGGATRNRGIREAKGSIIAFLDDDDIWLPNKLEVQMSRLMHAGPDVGFAFSGVVNVWDNGREVETHVEDGVRDFHELALARPKGFLTVTLLVRREVFDAVGLFDEEFPSHQEAELIIRITKRYKGLGVDLPLVRVSMGGEDHVGGNVGRRITGRRMILRKHGEEFRSRPEVHARHLFQIALWERQEKKYQEAASTMWEAFRLVPSFRSAGHVLFLALRAILPWARTVFGILAAGGLLFLILRNVAFADLAGIVSEANLALLALVPVVVLIGHATSVFRWKIMLRTLGVSAPYGRLAFVFAANLPATKLLPSYSGDFLRTAYLRDTVPVLPHAGIIAAEAVLDIAVLAGIVFLGGLHLLLLADPTAAALLLGGIVGLLFVFVRYLLPVLIRRVPVVAMFLSQRQVWREPRFLATVVSLTVLLWMTSFFSAFVIFRALSLPVSFLDILLIQPIIVFATLLPFTPGGIGVREAGMALGYGGVIGAEGAILAGMIMSLVSAILFPILALPFFFRAMVHQPRVVAQKDIS